MLSTVAKLLARRILALLLTLVLISLLVFALLYLAPGSPIQVLLGTRPENPATVAALTARYHLTDGFLQQYWYWLRSAVQLNFGTSIQTGQPVTSLIESRLPVTLFLGIYAFILAVGLGIPLGIMSALRGRTIVDRAAVSTTILGVSTPVFVSGVLLLYVFAIVLGWFPVYGPGSGFTDRLWHLTLPAVALAFSTMALIVKLTRASMIGVLEQDYVAFATARGVPRRHVITRYALRNALGPIITSGGLVLAIVLTGAVLAEVTFALPGIGSLLVDAAEAKDVPVVQGVTLMASALIISANILIDVLYVIFDPRVRFDARTK